MPTSAEPCYSQRPGQPDSTSFLLERNEARENAKKLQVRLTASETKVKELGCLAHVQKAQAQYIPNVLIQS